MHKFVGVFFVTCNKENSNHFVILATVYQLTHASFTLQLLCLLKKLLFLLCMLCLLKMNDLILFLQVYLLSIQLLETPLMCLTAVGVYKNNNYVSYNCTHTMWECCGNTTETINIHLIKAEELFLRILP